MATRSKSTVGDAKEEGDRVRTLHLRIKDKHATYLRELAVEWNLVWNDVNALSYQVFRRERRFPSGYDLQKYTNGAASREGLRLHSQTIQAIAAE